jgi:hypothetical protein
MGHELGLSKLQEDAQAVAKAQGKTEEEIERNIHYDLYAPCCSDPEVVRKHLDSGVLVDILSKKEAKILAPLTGSQDEAFEHWFSDPCYMYVLLSACAMTLGCHLPASCIALLKKIFTEGGLMPDAQRQMYKALFGPDGYKDGVPYNFESKSLLEEVNAEPEKRDSGLGYKVMNVADPGGIFSTGKYSSCTK